MRDFIYKKLLRGFPLIKTPFSYNGIIHVTPNYAHTIGFSVWIGKQYLRQGISLHIPYFNFSFYIHNKEKAHEIWYKNNHM